MKIAIHHQKDTFSEVWILYCEREKIPYKIVDCFDSDIISQLSDCDGLMWNWDLNSYKAALNARQIIRSLKLMGLKVYPDANTSWHYDDKVGQKYLLETINAPIVSSYVFYTKQEALNWIEKATFPKVFKLRAGAGSLNVRLVKTKSQAKHLTRKAFGKGFLNIGKIASYRERIWVLKRDRNLRSFINLVKGIARFFMPNELAKFSPNEIGYIYFQDFVPDNNYDTRIIIIGNRCIGLRRFCRDGDFRASGSGIWDYNPEYVNKDAIKIAFEVAGKIKAQSLAFDFVIENQMPKIIEISYCFPLRANKNAPGYWDENLIWHDGKVNAEEYIIEDFIKKLI